MTKKIFGILSILIVVFMVIVFFFPDTNKKKEAEPIPAKTETTSSQTTKKVDKDLPNVSRSDWQLVLVNHDHLIMEEPKTLTTMKNGYQIDQRIYDAYYEMEEAAAKAGFSLTVISSYRSVADQQAVFDADVTKYLTSGLTEKEAETKAEEYVTHPGGSEHHTGLAVDVVDQVWYDQGNGLEEGFFETEAGKWIDQNCAKYGFIIRYPKNKEGLTGINYEPWHLRYVGKESANYMVTHQLVLEEYLDVLKEAGR
ncbi:M15 family metallopeptidase [uncultured Vagococcus sp.]|uniref:M15 family metallopeptidase n=1 Tax=uncultured Vagococcus sp. TaxID=189676 RepID=UPI0028D11546|nr:M15 family metallopeptidase [uncultured Vagococcus sp.]